jgi:Na+/H+ antiporter NhaD/arsenite permease-like protein
LHYWYKGANTDALSALEAAGLLTKLADVLNNVIPNETLVAGTIGAVSAVIDNVPLVAAAMGM